MGSVRLAEHILAVLRSSFGLSLGVVRVRTSDGHDLWRIDATNARGERWVAMDADYYRSAVLLAGLLGADLDG